MRPAIKFKKLNTTRECQTLNMQTWSFLIPPNTENRFLTVTKWTNSKWIQTNIEIRECRAVKMLRGHVGLSTRHTADSYWVIINMIVVFCTTHEANTPQRTDGGVVRKMRDANTCKTRVSCSVQRWFSSWAIITRNRMDGDFWPTWTRLE